MRITIKIGSNVLTRADGSLDVTRLSALVDQIAVLRQQGIEVLLVSSGAVACGRSVLHSMKNLKTKDNVDERQLFSAVGQAKLIDRYYELFRDHRIHVGQVLTMKQNFSTPISYSTQQNCMEVMLENGVIPIINENDSISTAEIAVGDNDTLGAHIATAVQSDLLIILSDIDAVYDSNPKVNPDAKRISVVTEVTDELISGAGGAGSALGTGGMQTKITAMSMLMDHGIAGVIAEGSQSQILEDILEGEDIGTLFVPKEKN